MAAALTHSSLSGRSHIRCARQWVDGGLHTRALFSTRLHNRYGWLIHGGDVLNYLFVIRCGRVLEADTCMRRGRRLGILRGTMLLRRASSALKTPPG